MNIKLFVAGLVILIQFTYSPVAVAIYAVVFMLLSLLLERKRALS